MHVCYRHIGPWPTTSAVDCLLPAQLLTACWMQKNAKICLMCAQAQSEVAQLQSQLQDAVTQQEALQQALHDMQSPIAVLRDQIEQQAQAGSHDADAHLQPAAQQRGSSNSMQQLSQAAPAGALLQSLQQQVADLKDLSARLSNNQQQHLKHQLSQSLSLDRPNHHGRAGGDIAGPRRGLAEAHGGMTRSPRGLSALGAGLKHDCMMPPPGPRSVPNRRLPMSSYASPASQPDPHLTDVIKAHHPPRQSTAETTAGDKCWCGRPKKLTGSAVSKPSNRGTARTVDGVSSARQHSASLHTPPRFPDR